MSTEQEAEGAQVLVDTEAAAAADAKAAEVLREPTVNSDPGSICIVASGGGARQNMIIA